MQTCSSSVEGGETQKRKKHRSENFMEPLPTSVQVMGNFLDKGPKPSLQVVYENNNLQTGSTADIRRQRNLSHFLEAESEGLRLITYSRRSSKAGHMQKKKNLHTSQENLQKSVSHSRNSSIVAGFRMKSLLGIYGKEDGPMREDRQGDRPSTISTVSDQDKANFSGFTRRRSRKRRNKTSSNVRQVSVSEQGAIVSKGSENICSVKNGDLHSEILSKSDMGKDNHIDQRMSVKQDSSGVQIDSIIITVNKSDLHSSPRHTPKIPAVKGSLSSTSGTRTSNSSSGLAGSVEKFSQRLTAEASRAETPATEIAAQIVVKSPSEVALRVESTCPIVSKEGGVAKTDAQAAGLESTPINISPPISEEEPPSAVEPECRVTSSLADGAPKASQSFPALGVEWPDDPQFGLALGSAEVATQLVQSLDLLLQVDPLPTVEAMRSKLEECTRGYRAFGLPRDTWMAKLAALWDEFTRLHAIQAQRQKTKMIQQEEELLCRLQATQADVYAQVEAARERGRRASLRSKELKRKVQALLHLSHGANQECCNAQAEAETLQCKLDGLQRKVLLSESRILVLRRKRS